MLPLVILLEFGGGLAILFGFLTRTTALFTAGFTLLTAFLFHSNFAEGVNSLMFMKNLTIAGGFLLLAITGPGAFSIDRVLNKNGKRAILTHQKRGDISSLLLSEEAKIMGQLIDGVWHDTGMTPNQPGKISTLCISFP